MHEGQQYDYRELIKRGLTWEEAMDYTDSHPLGKSTNAELDRYASAILSQHPQDA